MSALKLGRKLELPLDVVTRTTAIVGQRGTGKTSTAVVLVEEAARAGAQAAVIDPTGAWYGLRTSADGLKAGLEVVVFGGHHGDVPLEPGAGAFLARLVIDQGLSVVLDLELMTKGKQVQFVAEFADELYHRNRTALTLVIDEAHRFAPQQLRDPGGYGARCLGAVTDVVTLGRRKGLGAVLISQRPAKINKDVFEQAEVMIAHRLMGPNDRKAIAGWLDETGATDERPAGTQPDAVRHLARGDAIVYAPSYEVYGQFSIRLKRTFDSSATPEIGAHVIEPKGRADVDLAAIEQAMADTIERAKADDPKALRRKVKELQAQLADRPDPDPIVETVEVPVIGDEQLERLRSLADELGALANDVAQATHALTAAVQTVIQTPPRAPAAAARPSPAARPAPARPSAPPPAAEGEPQLKAGARRILEQLARHHPMRFTKAQVGTLVGMKVTGGTFNTYWSVLRRAGYIDEAADDFGVTELGLQRAGITPEQPATTEEMVAMWSSRLKAGARRMLDILVANYPNALAKDDLAAALEMEPSGGTFNTYVSTLRRNGLADVDAGMVTASDTLFIGGA